MKPLFAALMVLVLSCSAISQSLAGPKKWGGGPKGTAKKMGVPPGHAKKKYRVKKQKVPPGLAKKGGLPPGIAKKYAVGERLPAERYRIIDPDLRSRLPYVSPEGRKWVRVGRDIYLLSNATGTIVDVVQDWLD